MTASTLFWKEFLELVNIRFQNYHHTGIRRTIVWAKLTETPNIMKKWQRYRLLIWKRNMSSVCLNVWVILKTAQHMFFKHVKQIMTTVTKSHTLPPRSDHLGLYLHVEGLTRQSKLIILRWTLKKICNSRCRYRNTEGLGEEV